MNSHSEQLQNPNWQKRRLFIFQRDNWSCKCCGNDKIQLEVHHLFYLENWKLWEYPDDWLLTLCNTCHKKEKTRDTIYMNLLNALKTKGFLVSDILAMATLIETDDHFKNSLLESLRNFQNL